MVWESLSLLLKAPRSTCRPFARIRIYVGGYRTSASAAGEEDQAADLAKKLNNPISSLISVPFQSNWDFNIGTADGTRYTLNIQPVIPLSISKDWNLIIRTILPVISQDNVFGNSGTQSGLGNTTQSFFLSPKASWNGVTWGLGPVGYYPQIRIVFLARINGASGRRSSPSCSQDHGRSVSLPTRSGVSAAVTITKTSAQCFSSPSLFTPSRAIPVSR